MCILVDSGDVKYHSYRLEGRAGLPRYIQHHICLSQYSPYLCIDCRRRNQQRQVVEKGCAEKNSLAACLPLCAGIDPLHCILPTAGSRGTIQKSYSYRAVPTPSTMAPSTDSGLQRCEEYYRTYGMHAVRIRPFHKDLLYHRLSVS